MALAKALEVSCKAARRLLLYKQGLLHTKTFNGWRTELRGVEGVLTCIERLGAVQIDPVMVLKPNQHLVLQQRVGRYRDAQLERLLRERRVFEYFANARCVLPIGAFPHFAPRMRRRAAQSEEAYPQAAGTKQHILARLRAEGPLAARHFASDKVIGYWDGDQARTKLTTLAIELLWEGGQIALSHRDGNERFYDLMERIIPEPLRRAGENTTPEDAEEAIARLYCKAFGLFDAADPRFGWRRWSTGRRKKDWLAEQVAAGFLTPVAIEGVTRPYWLLSRDLPLLSALDTADPKPDTYLLPPLDNFLWRRERIRDLFAFDYTWEIYVPAAKRRYGSYTMPVLEGEVLIGRLEAKVDRPDRRLDVVIFELEPKLRSTKLRLGRIQRALEKLAHSVGATDVRWLVSNGC